MLHNAHCHILPQQSLPHKYFELLVKVHRNDKEGSRVSVNNWFVRTKGNESRWGTKERKAVPERTVLGDKDGVHGCGECIPRTRKDHLTEHSGWLTALTENG